MKAYGLLHALLEDTGFRLTRLLLLVQGNHKKSKTWDHRHPNHVTSIVCMQSLKLHFYVKLQFNNLKPNHNTMTPATPSGNRRDTSPAPNPHSFTSGASLIHLHQRSITSLDRALVHFSIFAIQVQIWPFATAGNVLHEAQRCR